MFCFLRCLDRYKGFRVLTSRWVPYTLGAISGEANSLRTIGPINAFSETCPYASDCGASKPPGSFCGGRAVYYSWDVERQEDADVAHADRGENVRIISARKATQRERKHYEEKN